MKFLVIGHFSLDVFHPASGPETMSFGGIYHTVATLASLLEQNDRVLPVFGVAADDYPALLAELERLPAVETSGIYVSEEPTNRVHYYRDGQTITECPKEIAPPISFERIRRNLGVDGILVNMVSGFDITMETLDQIRMAVSGNTIPMHFDYHNLTLGIGPDHRRYRRPIPEWRRWAFMMDIVQLNEIEVAGLTLEGLPEDKTVGHLLTLGVKGVVVTRGQRGATVYHNKHKRVVREDVAGVAVDGDTDAVGSGDVFGAAFHYRYVKTPELLGAAEFANSAAASHVRRHTADKLF